MVKRIGPSAKRFDTETSSKEAKIHLIWWVLKIVFILLVFVQPGSQSHHFNSWLASWNLFFSVFVSVPACVGVCVRVCGRVHCLTCWHWAELWPAPEQRWWSSCCVWGSQQEAPGLTSSPEHSLSLQVRPTEPAPSAAPTSLGGRPPHPYTHTPTHEMQHFHPDMHHSFLSFCIYITCVVRCF